MASAAEDSIKDAKTARPKIGGSTTESSSSDEKKYGKRKKPRKTLMLTRKATKPKSASSNTLTPVSHLSKSKSKSKGVNGRDRGATTLSQTIEASPTELSPVSAICPDLDDFGAELHKSSPDSKPTRAQKELLQASDVKAEREKLPKLEKRSPNSKEKRTRDQTLSSKFARSNGQGRVTPPPMKLLLRPHTPPSPTIPPLKPAKKSEEREPRRRPSPLVVDKRLPEVEPFRVAVLDRDHGGPINFGDSSSSPSGSDLPKSCSVVRVRDTIRYEKVGAAARQKLAARAIPSSEAPPLADISEEDIPVVSYEQERQREKKKRKRRRRSRLLICFEKRTIVGRKGSRKRVRFYWIMAIVLVSVALVSVCIGMGIHALATRKTRTKDG